MTGAGDTVLATCALALGAGGTFEEARVLANHAAGVVVGKVGTATVSAGELRGGAGASVKRMAERRDAQHDRLRRRRGAKRPAAGSPSRSRGVNQRFLDVRVTAPREYAAWEATCASSCGRTRERGRVDVDVGRSRAGGAAGRYRVAVRERAGARLRRGGARARPPARARGRGRPRPTAAAPELFEVVERPPDLARELPVAAPGARPRRSRAFDRERRREGAHLAARHAGAGRRACARSSAAIRARAAGASQAALRRQRRASGSARLPQGVEVDPARVAQEVAALAERSDVTEELVRLESHLDALRRRCCGAGGAVGKRIEFLLQEIHREINTIGSKATDARDHAARCSRPRARSRSSASRCRTSSEAGDRAWVLIHFDLRARRAAARPPVARLVARGRSGCEHVYAGQHLPPAGRARRACSAARSTCGARETDPSIDRDLDRQMRRARRATGHGGARGPPGGVHGRSRRAPRRCKVFLDASRGACAAAAHQRARGRRRRPSACARSRRARRRDRRRYRDALRGRLPRPRRATISSWTTDRRDARGARRGDRRREAPGALRVGAGHEPRRAARARSAPTIPPPTLDVDRSAPTSSPPRCTTARAAVGRAVPDPSARGRRASSPTCSSTCRASSPGCCTTPSRTRSRRSAQIEAIFGAEIATLVDGVTKIGQINFTQPRGDAGGELPQDDPRDGARHPRHPDQARRPHAQHADALTPAARASRRDRAGDARHLRAARAPPRHLLDQERARGQRAALPAPGGLLPAQAQRREEEGRAREVHRRRARRCSTSSSTAAGIEATVTGRPKHFYSIYQKMQRAEPALRPDLRPGRVPHHRRLGARVLRGARRRARRTGSRCRGASRTTSRCRRPTCYQSLHTTVIGPFGERIEVQIRTHEMHRVAEVGIAAHWKYKGRRRGSARRTIAALRLAAPAARVAAAPRGPARVPALGQGGPLQRGGLRVHAEGRPVELPAGRDGDRLRLPHPLRGRQHCAGARVNGKLVPLRYQLQSGDTVEIVTTTRQTPSKDWLKLVKTPRAKERIRDWIKSAAAPPQPRGRPRDPRRATSRRHHLDLGKLRSDGTLERAAHELGLKDEEALIAGVGYGKLTAQQVLARARPRRASSTAPRGERRARCSGCSGWSAGSRRRGVQVQRRRRRAGALRPLLQSAAGRAHRRLHHARPRRHRARDRLPEGAGERSAAARRRACGSTATAACRAGAARGDVRRRPGLLAAMTKAISSAGINISRAQVHARGRPAGAEHLRGHGDDARRAESGHARTSASVRGVMKVQRVRA